MTKSLNIFVGDDDRDVAEGLAEVLEVSGHSVELAHSGEAAMRLLRDQKFDIAFINAKLPGMTGIESFLEVHKIQPTTRAIMMTGYTVEQLLTQAVADGAVRLVQKPFGLDTVQKALESVVPNGMVMVAEDDPNFCEELRDKLSRHNYRIMIARTGKEALEAVRSGDLDVLVLDLRVPFVSGLEVYLELKKRGHSLPTILVSGIVSIADGAVDMLHDICVKGILAKPFDPAKLLSALQNVSGTPCVPFSPEEEPTLSDQKPSSPQSTEAPQASLGRILVVDDDRDVTEGMADVLKFSNYEVEMAFTAEAAEQISETFDAHIALIDIQLGRNNGLELIKKLKERQPKLFAVVVTAKADQQSAIDALRSGADDYLNKPLHPHELFKVLNRGFEAIGLLEAMPQEATQSDPDFLASVSYELRDPLNAVIGFSEILSEEMLGPLGSEQYVSYASGIKQAGEHLTTVIDEMLEKKGHEDPAEGEASSSEFAAPAADPTATRPDEMDVEQAEPVPAMDPAPTSSSDADSAGSAALPPEAADFAEPVLNESFDLEQGAADLEPAAPDGTEVPTGGQEDLAARPAANKLNIAVSYQADPAKPGSNGSEWFELDATKADLPEPESREEPAPQTPAAPTHFEDTEMGLEIPVSDRAEDAAPGEPRPEDLSLDDQDRGSPEQFPVKRVI